MSTIKKQDYHRKMPAAKQGEDGFAKFTNKQLAVLYWLISKAYWNKERREKHYFVYRNTINYAQMGKDLGIKSVYHTIPAALEKLELYGKIMITNDAIILPHAELYTYLHIDLIKFLLAYSAVVGADLILFYSVLKRFWELNNRSNTPTNFCVKLFIQALGHNVNDSNEYKKMKIYIALLKSWELIKVSESIGINKGGKFTEYTLWKIEQDLPINLYIEEAGEKVVNINEDDLSKIKSTVDFKL